MAHMLRLLPNTSPFHSVTNYRTTSTFSKISAHGIHLLNTVQRSSSGLLFTELKYRTFATTANNYHTVDQKELKNFDDNAKKMWAEQGEYELLHLMNRIRVPYIVDGILGSRRYSAHSTSASPLEGKILLDVGCGGGILSEPLARLGARVTGIDASESSIHVAKLHCQLDPKLASKLEYLCEDIVNLRGVQFDAVIASEVVEHVSDVDLFLDGCCRLVKPGGSIFITTINKTRLSYLLTITMAENILRVVPKGMHDWKKYIGPEEVRKKLSSRCFVTTDVSGMIFNPLINRWSWNENLSVNYALHAVKMQMEFPSTDDQMSP